MPIKLLIADDSDVMRGAIRRVLQESLDVDLVGEATNLTQTARLASELKPDVIVIDLHMSDSDERTLAEVLRASLGCPIIAMSLYDDEETKKMADSFKAVRFLDKTKVISRTAADHTKVQSHERNRLARINNRRLAW